MCNKCNSNKCTCNHNLCSHDDHCHCDTCTQKHLPSKEFYRTNMWNDYQDPHISDCKPHTCDSCVDFNDANCTLYTQDDLECTGIKSQDNLNVALKKIDTITCTILDELSGIPQDVVIHNIPGLTFNKAMVGSTVYFTPVLDYYYIAGIVCAICDNPNYCAPITGFTITGITSTSFNINLGTPMGVGETYDVSINGGTSYGLGLSGLTASSVTVTGLTANTTYSVVLRHHCSNSGMSTSTATPVTTNANLACPSITGLVVTYGAYNVIDNSYPVVLTWNSVSGATNYEVFLTGTGSLGTTTAPTFTFDLPAGTVFSGYIQANCSVNSSNNPFNGTVPATAVCPNPTTLIVTLS